MTARSNIFSGSLNQIALLWRPHYPLHFNSKDTMSKITKLVREIKLKKLLIYSYASYHAVAQSKYEQIFLFVNLIVLIMKIIVIF